jgi:hypothetical protein
MGNAKCGVAVAFDGRATRWVGSLSTPCQQPSDTCFGYSFYIEIVMGKRQISDCGRNGNAAKGAISCPQVFILD